MEVDSSPFPRWETSTQLARRGMTFQSGFSKSIASFLSYGAPSCGTRVREQPSIEFCLEIRHWISGHSSVSNIAHSSNRKVVGVQPTDLEFTNISKFRVPETMIHNNNSCTTAQKSLTDSRRRGSRKSLEPSDRCLPDIHRHY